MCFKTYISTFITPQVTKLPQALQIVIKLIFESVVAGFKGYKQEKTGDKSEW